MKNSGKNLFHEVQINPIGRDLLLVTGMGLLVAMGIVTFGVMIFSQL